VRMPAAQAPSAVSMARIRKARTVSGVRVVGPS
jgi:hypothetical protein